MITRLSRTYRKATRYPVEVSPRHVIVDLAGLVWVGNMDSPSVSRITH